MGINKRIIFKKFVFFENDMFLDLNFSFIPLLLSKLNFKRTLYTLEERNNIMSIV